MTLYARQERAALADLMESVGPDAPTLCGGWDTSDLAAHIIARERRLDAAPGIIIPFLAGWTERVRRGIKAQHSFAELVHLVRTGPPRWSPMSTAAFEYSSNTSEFFIHHEDIRRAQPGWSPRELDDELHKALWGRLKATARLAVRSAPAGLTLTTPTGRTIVAKSGEPMVTVSGLPSELALYCSGRQAHALVDAEGDPDAVAALAKASFGV